MRPVCVLILATVGCAPAPPAVRSAPEPVSITVPAALAPSAPPVADPKAPPAASWVLDEEGKGTPLAPDLDAAKVPDAPCFGARIYRGTIGKARVTLKLAASGARWSGLAHYDVSAASLEVSGEIKADAFSLVEKGAGRFEGTCDARTGTLTGSYDHRGKKSAFTLLPRPQGEAALHAVREHLQVTSPVPPHCARLGRTKETQTLKEGLCLPTDPAALAALQEETSLGRCSFELATPRVFGLADPAAERAVNAALSQEGFGYASAEVRTAVKQCPAGEETRAGGGFTIVHNADEVLSVYFSGYVSQANAAHAASLGPEPVVVDLRSGKRLSIGDVVSDEAAFREAILACGGDRDELEWGGKDAYRKAPRWVLVPGGVAVIVGSVAPIKNGMQGTGPVVSFAALAARKLLRADSPVARLWTGMTPAPVDAPFCQGMMGSGEILTRRRKAASPP